MKGQVLFFEVPHWEMITTGRPTLFEEEEFVKNNPPTRVEQYARYCPNCEETWKGRYHEDLTCWGCGQIIRRVNITDLTPELVGYLRYLNHE